ncbi:MAG: serine--tRNA ligase [Malacoplasma sp.]
MLDKKIFFNDFQIIKTALKNRNSKIDIVDLTSLLSKNKALTLEIEQLNFKRNTISKDISKLISENKQEDANSLKEEILKIKKQFDLANESLKSNEIVLNEILLSLPNIPNVDVPIGKDENDNKVIKLFGKPRQFDFSPKAHWELGIEKDIVDFDRATKITGSRFVVYKGKGSKLVRALQNFTLDLHSEKGYLEFSMPVIVNSDSLYGTGNLPKFEEDLFKINDTKYYLSPTLEVQLTNYYRNEILSEKDLPFKCTASSLNFRSEAGSAGRDTKGVIRQHQFYKTEMVNLVKPTTSFDELENMTRNAESILEKLNLPYRRILLCTGDMGFSSAKTYDIEVWLPSYNAYKEISSCSNCLDFQARRAMIRYKNEETSKNELVHTLNGSGLAIDRLWAAVVENYQTKDGNIEIPKELIQYLNFTQI